VPPAFLKKGKSGKARVCGTCRFLTFKKGVSFNATGEAPAEEVVTRTRANTTLPPANALQKVKGGVKGIGKGIHSRVASGAQILASRVRAATVGGTAPGKSPAPSEAASALDKAEAAAKATEADAKECSERLT
jgi:hypothetical protein